MEYLCHLFICFSPSQIGTQCPDALARVLIGLYLSKHRIPNIPQNLIFARILNLDLSINTAKRPPYLAVAAASEEFHVPFFRAPPYLCGCGYPLQASLHPFIIIIKRTKCTLHKSILESSEQTKCHASTSTSTRIKKKYNNKSYVCVYNVVCYIYVVCFKHTWNKNKRAHKLTTVFRPLHMLLNLVSLGEILFGVQPKNHGAAPQLLLEWNERALHLLTDSVTTLAPTNPPPLPPPPKKRYMWLKKPRIRDYKQQIQVQETSKVGEQQQRVWEREIDKKPCSMLRRSKKNTPTITTLTQIKPNPNKRTK